ncbi:MAG: 1,2-phenylacetyl-CoA epoxidase subunit PaaC [Terriglobia bacterium]
MTPETADHPLLDFALRLGDDRLVLGHRLSEWCGHAPLLEEDIALANIALDLLGHAIYFLQLAGRVEGQGRTEDDFAYFREAVDFRNVRMVELPKGDFAFTMVRLFLFSVYSGVLYPALERSANTDLAAIAAKAAKETQYHVRHCREWVLRLGNGTEESHRRAQNALDALWPYTGELFLADSGGDDALPELGKLQPAWETAVSKVLREAEFPCPPVPEPWKFASRTGRHSEHLGHLLAEMQIVARSFPNATW